MIHFPHKGIDWAVEELCALSLRTVEEVDPTKAYFADPSRFAEFRRARFHLLLMDLEDEVGPALSDFLRLTTEGVPTDWALAYTSRK